MSAPTVFSPGIAGGGLRRPGGSRFWARFKEDRAAVLGLVIVIGMAVMAVAAPLLPSLDPIAQDLSLRRAPPNAQHPFGRDHLGRDILARVIYGARTTFGAAIGATLIALCAGTMVGLTAGYWGGWGDEISMRAAEVMLAFPYLLLAILIVAVLGPGLGSAIVAVGITQVPHYARVTRSAALVVRRSEYVEAVRALGASNARVIVRHVLPNVMASIIVLATVGMGAVILSIAGLSFLGMGAQPPIPEWGLMVSEGSAYLLVAPHISTVPGIFLMLLVLTFNLIGDGCRDALDPRLRSR